MSDLLELSYNFLWLQLGVRFCYKN